MVADGHLFIRCLVVLLVPQVLRDRRVAVAAAAQRHRTCAVGPPMLRLCDLCQLWGI